ncbi:MAG: c-type cytochrome [Chitinophagaceae bacterium]|nr:MAG: c-type cytochrome [Chitinophagaceae bacterium]
MIKRIFKWIGVILLLIVICISAVTPLRQNLKYEAPYPEISASTDSAVIARGKELVVGAAHCGDCHSTRSADAKLTADGELPLSGGFNFALPIGNIYARNITPDTLTGIGRRTDKELARVLRYGVHADGTAVFNFMPFQSMSDEDLTSIISYLRSLEPVRNNVPENSFNVVGNMIKAYMVKPVGPPYQENHVFESAEKDPSSTCLSGYVPY